MSLRETVQAWEDRYAAALSTPGAPGLERFFTDDADLLPPGPENLKGIEAIQSFWSTVSEHYHNAKLKTLDAEQMGSEFIREIGTYYAESIMSGGANLSGKYVFIWKKVGSDWKIWTDIWTSHSGQT